MKTAKSIVQLRVPRLRDVARKGKKTRKEGGARKCESRRAWGGSASKVVTSGVQEIVK